MKKSELRQLIREEISKILNEDEFESFLNSLNIHTDKKSLDRGIDIGSDVAIIGIGPGVVVDIDDVNKKYTVETGKGEKIVPFKWVQPIKAMDTDSKLLKKIKELEQEHKIYYKNFVKNLISSNKEDFKNERWKISSIADFYLSIGQQMWDMIKENYEYIIHSDEFEDLFFIILRELKLIQRLDNEMNDDLNHIIKAYEKIGDEIGGGIA
jgi:hypothetical protein